MHTLNASPREEDATLLAEVSRMPRIGVALFALTLFGLLVFTLVCAPFFASFWPN